MARRSPHQPEHVVVAHDEGIGVDHRQRPGRAALGEPAEDRARSAKGATRGETPPSISASAEAKLWRKLVERRSAEQADGEEPVRRERPRAW